MALTKPCRSVTPHVLGSPCLCQGSHHPIHDWWLSASPRLVKHHHAGPVMSETELTLEALASRAMFQWPPPHAHAVCTVRAVGHSAGEGAGGCSLYSPGAVGKSQNSVLLCFHVCEKRAVSAKTSSGDYWELKIPIQKGMGCQRGRSQWRLLFVMVPYFVASRDVT